MKKYKYQQQNEFHHIIFERWSYSISALCYVGFFLMIWLLSVPLKPQKRTAESNPFQGNFEDSFEIRIKSSNFDSDNGGDKSKHNVDQLEDKNEYLVNVNNHENRFKDETQILEDVFKKADRNHDTKLDPKELSTWIRSKIVEHIGKAVRNNYALFTQIDKNPPNGVITWNEYHAYFLKKRGFSRNYVKDHDEKRHKGLRRSLKEQIMKDKASWMEAARTNPDSLTVDEFLTFTHPESSATSQLALVDELYDKFDRDGDEFLTEDEFAILQTEGGDGVPSLLDDENSIIVIRQDENERRAEFRQSIDLNGDGKADRRELLHYVAPQSPRHSEHEAEALIALADSNNDHFLSLDEVLARPKLFLKSKMIDTARSFHDEF